MRPAVFCSAFFLFVLVTGYTTRSFAGEAPRNLLANPSFEEGDAPPGQAPDQWMFLAAEDSPVNGGIQQGGRTGNSAVFLGQPEGDDVLWEVLVVNLPVESSRRYAFKVWVKPDPSDPLKEDSSGKISIEWKDGGGTEVGRVVGTRWTRETFAKSADWQEMSVEGEAPAAAASASFVITYDAGIVVGAGGKFLIDDAAVLETPR